MKRIFSRLSVLTSDPYGALFDGEGVRRDWWSAEARRAFRAQQDCLVREYDSFCAPELGKCVNGRRSLSENAADLAGLHAAWLSWERRREPAPSGSPFSADQVRRVRAVHVMSRPSFSLEAKA